MKNRKIILVFILITVLAVTSYAQQYDPESDFNIRRVRVTRNSKIEEEIEITAYVGDKTDVRIPPRIQNLPVTGFSRNAFPSDTTSLVIPNSVTSIEEEAFKDYKSLKSVTIGNGVTRIRNYAFQGCTSLTSISIPNSVTNIGIDIFRKCTSLTSATIGNGVTIIEGGTFEDCTSLTSINIPNSVTSIRAGAFKNCTNLASVTIGNSVASIGGAQFVGGAFEGCTSLKNITIPNSVISIGEFAFQNCISLTSVTIGNSVTGIGRAAFSGCTSLTSVTIGNSVTSIGTIAFSGCTSLTSITIPNSVTRIIGGAFSNCTSLASVTIGRRVTEIGDGAFNNCASLTSVTFQSTINLSSNLFPGDLRTKYYEGGVGTYTRSTGNSERWWKQTAIFPIGFLGTWKRDTFNNTLTLTTNALKASNQPFFWILSDVSDDSYTFFQDDMPSWVSTIVIKLVNGNLVISGDSGPDEHNWNGTWKKQ
jgi:hypothetical protein